ncbi:MAG: dipeptide epimerase [Alphaproteobacteria bacterium]|nr:dipeptide epimerase [Alphaproteobacteria bacterium]
MSKLTLTVCEEVFPVDGVFTISRGSRTEIHAVTVMLSDGETTGWAECMPYARYEETVDGVIATIRSVEADLAHGMDRLALQDRLPAGAARNGLDCAFWDFEAKQSGRPVWQLAGLDEPGPLETTYTLSLAAPESMRAQAAKNAGRPLLKVKLGTDNDIARIRSVREGAPSATIIVDANEGWSAAQYSDMAPVLAELGVALIEQPLPAKADGALLGLDRPVPVCADESCHTRASLPGLTGKYDFVNIKLDKTGGLTEALALKQAAQKAGLGIMVGCMLGTSLAMAPAMLVAQGARVADLDGPLLLAADRETPIRYVGALMSPPDRRLWG